MDHVRLGRSDLVCSVLGLGGGSSSRFGLKKGGSRSDALRLIHTALDHGITFFDGAGASGGVDALLAEGLAGRREDVVLSTKVHLGPDPFPFTNRPLANRVSARIARQFGSACSASVVRKRVEQALTALRTDRIDVLHLHAVSPRQYPRAVTKVLPELLKLKAEGKLRAIGITEGFLSDPDHEMLRAASAEAHFDAIMVGFNIRNSGAAECVLPAARKAGLGVIGMFALQQVLDAAGAKGLGRIGDEAGIPLPELAYRYARHQAGIDIVLTGTGNPEHLRANIAAALAPPLPDSVLVRLHRWSADQADGASTRK
jgi:aryl-alcohol dehydrogenase-like predicted oxidoreductase